MKVLVVREVFTDEFCLGTIYVDQVRQAYTCEDMDRHIEEGGTKVYGKTAIPRGTYKVVLSFSHHFQRILPEVLGVPGFTGVRIHGGNTADDSLGCILVGSIRTKYGVANCQPVITRLIQLMEEAEQAGEVITLEVK